MKRGERRGEERREEKEGRGRIDAKSLRVTWSTSMRVLYIDGWRMGCPLGARQQQARSKKKSGEHLGDCRITCLKLEKMNLSKRWW